VVDAEAGTEEAAASTPMEVEKEKAEDSKNQTPVPSNQPTPQQQQQQQPGQGQGPPQPPSKDVAPQIDLQLEASKLPLDVAIFNSARAAGGDDKIRKYLQAVLVVGGTALTPGIGHALESRYAFVFFITRFMGRWTLLLELRDKVFSFHSSFLLWGRLLLPLDLSWNGSDDRGGWARLLAGYRRLLLLWYKTWKRFKSFRLQRMSTSEFSLGRVRPCWDAWKV